MKMSTRIGLFAFRHYARKQIEAFLIEQGVNPKQAKIIAKEGASMLKNWKTSLLGILAGMAGISTVGFFTPNGKVNWSGVIMGILMAATGAMAKDHDVTGGSGPSV